MTPSMRYQSGLSAERSVARRYLRAGYGFVQHRWRGKAGEIDLIFERDGGFVFVEVKSSRSWARAAESLGARQVRRLMHSATDFLAKCPKGSLTPARFDVALVNETGDVSVLENALVG